MRTKFGANVIKDRVSGLKEAFHLLTLKDVLVGIPSDTAERKEDASLTNAEIGYIQEHGAPEANIPARPFLIPGIREGKDGIVGQLRAAAKKTMRGDRSAAEQGLNRAGMVAQNFVRTEINKGIAPSLAPTTIKARQRRGRTGTKPLIDTGQLRNSITYVLRGK